MIRLDKEHAVKSGLVNHAMHAECYEDMINREISYVPYLTLGRFREIVNFCTNGKGDQFRFMIEQTTPQELVTGNPGDVYCIACCGWHKKDACVKFSPQESV
jgi:hypothetical protein